MRRIVIPQEAIDRHEATLGKALLGYLECLAAGRTVKWFNRGQQSYQAKSPKEIDYWEWVADAFKSKHILSAGPVDVLAFAKENSERFRKIGSSFKSVLTQRQKLVLSASQAVFNYGAFRGGAILAPYDPKIKKIRWVTVPLSPPKKRAAKYYANKAIKDGWLGWSLAEFVRLLDVRYCPYCNAETVGVLNRSMINSDAETSFSALDHVLPKGKYPLLSLSLYNLVPACYRCNSQFKGKEDGFDVEHWKPGEPFKMLHPYAHDISKWFRFNYSPREVEHLFMKPQGNGSPLSITCKVPIQKVKRAIKGKSGTEFYLDRVAKHIKAYHLLESYRDLYSVEINEILKMEMICTPTFIEAMKKVYQGITDEDFNLSFRRTSLDPREINHHRFAKLIIDLHRQIGSDGLSYGKNGTDAAGTEREAWEARKRLIEERLRKGRHYEASC